MIKTIIFIIFLTTKLISPFNIDSGSEIISIYELKIDIMKKVSKYNSLKIPFLGEYQEVIFKLIYDKELKENLDKKYNLINLILNLGKRYSKKNLKLILNDLGDKINLNKATKLLLYIDNIEKIELLIENGVDLYFRYYQDSLLSLSMNNEAKFQYLVDSFGCFDINSYHHSPLGDLYFSYKNSPYLEESSRIFFDKLNDRCPVPKEYFKREKDSKKYKKYKKMKVYRNYPFLPININCPYCDMYMNLITE